jgi:hypothetical protein
MRCTILSNLNRARFSTRRASTSPAQSRSFSCGFVNVFCRVLYGLLFFLSLRWIVFFITLYIPVPHVSATFFLWFFLALPPDFDFGLDFAPLVSSSCSVRFLFVLSVCCASHLILSLSAMLSRYQAHFSTHTSTSNRYHQSSPLSSTPVCFSPFLF